MWRALQVLATHNPTCNQADGQPSAADAQAQAQILHSHSQGRPHEFIRDQSRLAFYGIDNSGSMGHRDGKSMLAHASMLPTSDFAEIATATCNFQYRQTRWTELVEAVKLVALYNVKRGIKAVYMILNPQGRSKWVAGVDFVVVDPETPQAEQQKQLAVLFNVILQDHRVGGTTPLDRLTDEFRRQLRVQLQQQQQQQSTSAGGGANANANATSHDNDGENQLVSYTLFTDGLPDSKQRFEASLRFLSQECRLGSITMNLTTDEDHVLDYFNGLDSTLGAKTASLEVRVLVVHVVSCHVSMCVCV